MQEIACADEGLLKLTHRLLPLSRFLERPEPVMLRIENRLFGIEHQGVQRFHGISF